ncbi:MAG: MBL fold metallo-hydrolase [Pseudomonadota bacterium]
MRLTILVTFLLAVATGSTAQDRERRPSHCFAIAERAPGLEYLQKASWSDPLEEFTARISYVSHSMFLIQSPEGRSAVTDYSGFLGAVDFAPDAATMNNAHNTHWTASPDPRIPHVLQGWKDADGVPADHHLEVGDMLIRNVTTDVRAWAAPADDNNSVFIFEVAGLCVGHLGHLHHALTDAHYTAIGRLDVVMVPVDGGLTIDTPTVSEIVRRLKSSVVIPMHWFERAGLETFLSNVSDEFAVERVGGPSIELSLRSLPSRPTVMVLEPEWLSAPE